MNFWTPERIKILREQWAAGASAQAIAAHLGSGRNAVIGKANRLGLPAHAAARRRQGPVKRALKDGNGETTRKRASAPRSPWSPAELLVEARPIRFADLLRHHCRYPVTDDAPFLFCGEVRRGRSAYCAFHHALSYEAPRADEKRPAAPRQPRGRFHFALVRVSAG